MFSTAPPSNSPATPDTPHYVRKCESIGKPRLCQIESPPQMTKPNSRMFTWGGWSRRHPKLRLADSSASLQSACASEPHFVPTNRISDTSSSDASVHQNASCFHELTSNISSPDYPDCLLPSNLQPERVIDTHHLRHSDSWSEPVEKSHHAPPSSCSNLSMSLKFSPIRGTSFSARRILSSPFTQLSQESTRSQKRSGTASSSGSHEFTVFADSPLRQPLSPDATSTCSDDYHFPSAQWSKPFPCQTPQNTSGSSRKHPHKKLNPPADEILGFLHVRRGLDNQISHTANDSQYTSDSEKLHGAPTLMKSSSESYSARPERTINHSPRKGASLGFKSEGPTPCHAGAVFRQKFLKLSKSHEALSRDPVNTTCRSRLADLSKLLAHSTSPKITGLISKPFALDCTPLSASPLLKGSSESEICSQVTRQNDHDSDFEDTQSPKTKYRPHPQHKRWAVIDMLSHENRAREEKQTPTSATMPRSNTDSHYSTPSCSPSLHSGFSSRSSISSRNTSISSIDYQVAASGSACHLTEQTRPESKYDNEVEDDLENAQVMTGSRVLCSALPHQHVRYHTLQQSPTDSSGLPFSSITPPNKLHQKGTTFINPAANTRCLTEPCNKRSIPPKQETVQELVVHEMGCAI